MSEIKMKDFGISLTGRPYGKDCYEKISREEIKSPYTLNFSGVITLGSSFGEEVIVPISKSSEGNPIKIVNANKAVIDCIDKIKNDFNLNILIE